jgi:glycosyltransferase involved in cell wall biosynthesis
MDWPSKCAAVIPCFNEEMAIGPVVAATHRFLPTVLVVDDGSTDQTVARAKAAGAVALGQGRNCGKGAALQAGWRWAREHGFSWAMTLDGDGQHSPEDIPSFLRCAEQGAPALVVGNRMDAAVQMPWLRRVVNRWMSRQLSKVAGQSLPDSQCGFRLINLEAWSGLPITVSRFEIESEVLIAFAAAGHQIAFVPIRVLYKSEQSKIHPLWDTLRWFRWWRRARQQDRLGKF